MKITVMGTGGVGGYFGAKLATAGNNVSFVARGPHLDAIRKNGLRIKSDLGDITVAPANASQDPRDFGIADIILFCVKAYDTANAAELILPCIGPETGVIPFLNGIGHMKILEERFGAGHVLGGVANVSALIEKPGVIRHFGQMQVLRVGEIDNTESPRVTQFRKACVAAGFEAPLPNSIERELWQKVVMICTLAGANCLTRLPLGDCRSNPLSRSLMETLASEVIAVARANSVSLPDDQLQRTMSVLDMLPADMKASMLAALERGERLESTALNGEIDRLGREVGIETPMNRAVHAALAPHENGATKTV